MKRGIKKLKEKGKKTVTAELEQIYRRHALRPVRTEKLTEKQNHESLILLMFLKEKQDGLIKGRGVADGRKQRDKIEPKDDTSPTVSTEAFMLTETIDALEGRDVAVVDIPWAYLSADMDNEVHVVFRRTIQILW